MPYSANYDYQMKRQEPQQRSWTGDTGDGTSCGATFGYGNRYRNAENTFVSRRNTTPPRHKSSHLRFLTWVAYYRKSTMILDEIEQRMCPVEECSHPPFRTEEEMLHHVCDCSELQKGSYHCPDCDKNERISRYHGNSCMQPQGPLQRVRNSLRSAKNRCFHHESKPQHQSVAQSSPMVSELPSYQPNSFRVEMYSSPSNNGDVSPYLHQQGAGKQATSSATLGHSPTASHSAFRSRVTNQSPYELSAYAMSSRNQHFQPFDAAELSAGPIPTSYPVQKQHASNCSCSSSNTLEAMSERITSLLSLEVADSMPATEADETWENPIYPFTYASKPGQISSHELQSGTPPHPYNRPYIGKDGISSLGSFSSSESSSRPSTISSAGTTSSRNTSLSEQDFANQQALEHQVPVAIFEAEDMLREEPDAMDFDEELYSKTFDPACHNYANFEPLRLNNDIKQPIQWPPQFMANSNTGPAPSQQQYHYEHQPQLEIATVATQALLPTIDQSASTVSSPASSTLPSSPKMSSPIRSTRPSTRVSKPKHKANPKLKIIVKAKANHVCKDCDKSLELSNLSRHRGSCSAVAPGLSDRKVFKCQFKGCAKGFTRSDNLRVHQTKQGHITTVVEIHMVVERNPSSEWREQMSLHERLQQERHNLIHGIVM